VLLLALDLIPISHKLGETSSCYKDSTVHHLWYRTEPSSIAGMPRRANFRATHRPTVIRSRRHYTQHTITTYIDGANEPDHPCASIGRDAYCGKAACMDRASFWRTIDDAVAASSGDLNHEDHYIRDALLTSGTDACVGFDAIVAEVMSEAYTWDLWGAAHVINGGCSDDGFVYFRCWLIAQGEAVFTQAMLDPESLADVVNPDQPAEEREYEALLSLARSML
jgi:hypothetical protein